MNRPVVLVTSRQTTRKSRIVDYVAELHLGLLLKLGCYPLIVPVVEGSLECLPQYMQRMDGLLIVEGEDVEPHRYPNLPANFEYLEQTHPLKDEIEIRLLQKALRQKLPILGICRGSQLLNVVAGGSLYGDVPKEKNTSLIHIDNDHYDAYRHHVTFVKGTPLARDYGCTSLMVNSYHHQGVRDLAPRFKPMAFADDGLVEAFYDPSVPFTCGLQFHPERMLDDHPGNSKTWNSFGKAIHACFKSKNKTKARAKTKKP